MIEHVASSQSLTTVEYQLCFIHGGGENAIVCGD